MLFAGLEDDQPVAAREGVVRAGHRLDRDAPAGAFGQRGAGEDHQVRIALVGPERRAVELDAREAVDTAVELGKAVVELNGPDRAGPPEVARALYANSADGDAAVVALQHGAGRDAKHRLVDAARRDAAIR